MYKILAVILAAALISFSCTRKDDPTVNKDVKPNDNKQQNQQKVV